MASFVRLCENARASILEGFFQLAQEADERRQAEWDAAIAIQSVQRAHATKRWLKKQHESATIIQKTWRGHRSRKQRVKAVAEKRRQERMAFYNKQATIIQKMWRGYYTRKYVHNYYARKAYLEGIVLKNKITRHELGVLEKKKAFDAQERAIQEQRKLFEQAVCNKHHLLGTTHIEGALNRVVDPNPLRSISSQYANTIPPICGTLIPPPPLLSEDNIKSSKKIKEYIRNSLKRSLSPKPPSPPSSIPPLPKIQGPFKSPELVRKQRDKPLRPSLRVATSYTSALEAEKEERRKEWAKRITADRLDTTKPDERYELSLHATTSYGRLPYGSKYFREEDENKFKAGKDFRTLISPIPLFDDYGMTYS
eukprot:Colp12_sorted_trinity150504_noHs@23845